MIKRLDWMQRPRMYVTALLMIAGGFWAVGPFMDEFHKRHLAVSRFKEVCLRIGNMVSVNYTLGELREHVEDGLIPILGSLAGFLLYVLIFWAISKVPGGYGAAIFMALGFYVIITLIGLLFYIPLAIGYIFFLSFAFVRVVGASIFRGAAENPEGKPFTYLTTALTLAYSLIGGFCLLLYALGRSAYDLALSAPLPPL